VIINDMMEVSVYSCSNIELAAKARLQGNVYCHLIEMVMGSEVNGSLSHRPSAELASRPLAAERHAAQAAGDAVPEGQGELA